MKTKTLLLLLIIIQSHNLYSQSSKSDIRDWKPFDTSSYAGTYSINSDDLFDQSTGQIVFSFENGGYAVSYLDEDLTNAIIGKNLIIVRNTFSFILNWDINDKTFPKKGNKPQQYQGKFIIYNEKVIQDDGKTDLFHNVKGIKIENVSYYSKEINTKVESSSVLVEKNKDVAFYQAKNLLDHNYSTAWVEGVAGTGIGEYVEFTFENEWFPKEIAIVNGYAKSDAMYLKNARPKQLKLSYSDGTTQVIKLTDVNTLQTFNLEIKQKISWIKVEIVDVYKGSAYEDTCITEIDFN